MGDEVLILDTDFHSIENNPIKFGSVVLEDNVWVASRVIIFKGSNDWSKVCD
jgi:acetyltransferase-like isoleucine patch superfamily enzyme